MTKPQPPFILAPTIEGMYICPAADADAQNVKNLHQARELCRKKKQVGSAAVNKLLDTLEPGGPKGKVQVGFTSTIQLLELYQKTDKGWKIDDAHLDEILQVIREVQRPVVIYLMADHFASEGPLAEELAKDPRNVMQLRDGTPLKLGYFGYPIVPWTLMTDPAIPVNKYRNDALEYVIKRIKALPKQVQDRIVAYTLMGEVHHMFPDFENGMGNFDNISTTDYSEASIAGFRSWLQKRYGSIQEFRKRTGLDYASFDAITAPSKNIRKEKSLNFGEHYDTYADGVLTVAGWLWDPKNQVDKLQLFVDGKLSGEVERGLNRLDVYRAVDHISTPNTGYRINYDYSSMPPGVHKAQVVATAQAKQLLVGETEFVVVSRTQAAVSKRKPNELKNLPNIEKSLPGIRTWRDLPQSSPDLYYNPLARDWNEYRQTQVYGLLEAFHKRALDAGLPKDKLYSHQIVPEVNSSWNAMLFAADTTLNGSTPWKQGLNMYGGATNSEWMRTFMASRKISDYGVPEFNPQQWKGNGVHLAAMKSHMSAGARFISPYYFSVVPQRFKGAAEHGVNRMELGPDNTKDGSDKFYRAIIEFAND